MFAMINSHFPHHLSMDSAIEIRERLQTAAWLCLEELKASFEAYASELGIERRAQFVFDEPTWATYEDGKTDRLVGCFAAMVCDLTVAYLDEHNDPADHDPAVVEATILSLVKAVLKDPFELEPPTWPWRPDDLFDHEDFELAFRRMVRDVLNAMPSAMKTPSTGTKRLGTIRQALLRFFVPKEEPSAVTSSVSFFAEVPPDVIALATEASKPTRKADITLLKKADGSFYQSVDFPTAERYADIGVRRRQQLRAADVLKVVGQGQNRRITVESLLEYCPPEEDAK